MVVLKTPTVSVSEVRERSETGEWRFLLASRRTSSKGSLSDLHPCALRRGCEEASFFTANGRDS